METVTIYADVLFFYNFALNFLLLFLVSFASDRKFFVGRSILASGVGSLYACVLALETFPQLEHFVFWLFVSFFMIFTAFRVHKFREFVKLLVLYYLMNFMLAGGIRFSANFGAEHPGYISLVAVCWGVALLVLLGQIYVTSLKRKCVCSAKIVTVTHNGKTLTLRAFPDTGNTLIEPLEQSSVIIVKQNLLQDFVDQREPETLKHFRLIPCSTVTDQNAVLWGFKPDAVMCEEKPLRAVLAASDSIEFQEYDAIFNPIILIS